MTLDVFVMESQPLFTSVFYW